MLSTTQTPYEAIIDLANAAVDDEGSPVPARALSIRRTLLLGDRLYQRILIENQSGTRLSTVMNIKLEADFADVFEVRGAYERTGRRPTPPASNGRTNEVRFRYLGKDEIRRETIVEVTLPGRAENDPADGARLTWTLELEPLQSLEAEFTVEPSLDEARSQRRCFRALNRSSPRNQESGCTRARGWIVVPLDFSASWLRESGICEPS